MGIHLSFEKKLGLYTPNGGLCNQYQGWQHILVLAISTEWMYARYMQHNSYDTGPGHLKIVLVSVLPLCQV